MKEELLESVKEGMRVFLMAVIPLMIVEIERGEFDFKTITIAGVIAVLRFVDKYLHRSGIAEKGLTRF
jgi:hypothetical protein